MTAIAANPNDKLAETVLSRDPLLNSTLRTTCVATLMQAGHAENALPQRARANINCRIAPGETIEETRAKLAEIVDDPGIAVTANPQRGPIGKPAPLDPAVFGPAEKLAAEMYPGRSTCRRRAFRLTARPGSSTSSMGAEFTASTNTSGYRR